MVDATISLFVDTNSFLQMKDFNQVAWRELFPQADSIKLFVCNVVIAELDKHKTSTNQRRRNRARKSLSLIEEAAAAPDMTLSVGADKPKVDLAIWRGRPIWLDFPDLDPANPDDYLVAAAATEVHGIVLSHDTGPRIRARIAGVRAECPLDDWLLPAEQTDDQRKIGQLTRELEAAHNARPRLNIVMPLDDPLTLRATVVPYLGVPVVGKLAALTLEHFPRADIRVSTNRYSVLRDPFAIGQTGVDAYHDEYDQFVSKMHVYFTTLHESVARHALAQKVPSTVNNAGNVSAKNLTLNIYAEGQIELLADRQDVESHLGPIVLPKPPEPPRRKSFDGSILAGLNKPRDPTRFYWRERPAISGARTASLECADFRPGREKEVDALVYSVGDIPSRGRLGPIDIQDSQEGGCVIHRVPLVEAE
ncbi:PIN domain-containing protein, partial [Sphingomonas sp. LB-2]|uniref:PIN domain-containing protein n=1 Tax=Sphingomonas caeni TaxID=2984949 RepID=UPI0022323B0C